MEPLSGARARNRLPRKLPIGPRVRDQKTKEKAPDLRNRIFQMAFHKGLLVLGAGENSLRLCPPLLIDEEQAGFAIQTLDGTITEIERSL